MTTRPLPGRAMVVRNGPPDQELARDGCAMGPGPCARVFALRAGGVEQPPELDSGCVARLLSVPCREAVDVDGPRFRMSMRVRDGRARVVRDGRDDFLVPRDDETYFGVVRSPDVL